MYRTYGGLIKSSNIVRDMSRFEKKIKWIGYRITVCNKDGI